MQMNYNPEWVLTQEHTEAEVQNYTGSFCGFVLLDGSYDLQAMEKRLQTQHGITVWQDDMVHDFPLQDFMLDVPGAMVTISLIYEPIPEGEAEAAAAHAVWNGAQYAAKQHTAHLMIAVLPDTISAVDAGKLYCRIVSAALDDNTVLAVYTSGTILEPMQFRTHTVATDDKLPLDHLLFVDTYARDGGNCGYTVGMDAFGKDELEILDSAESMETIAHVLRMCAQHIIEEQKTLGWYITIDVNGVLWEGRRKDGVMVEGHSVQLNKQ